MGPSVVAQASRVDGRAKLSCCCHRLHYRCLGGCRPIQPRLASATNKDSGAAEGMRHPEPRSIRPGHEGAGRPSGHLDEDSVELLLLVLACMQGLRLL